jgi:hypothetical protein
MKGAAEDAEAQTPKPVNGGLQGFANDKRVMIFGCLLAVCLLILGFFSLATTSWGHVMIGSGLFLLMRQAAR